jgi:hypothetical protein
MTIELTCVECDQPATWIRSTQFAGDHPYCDHHARLEPDFNDPPDSYCYWYELEDK